MNGELFVGGRLRVLSLCLHVCVLVSKKSKEVLIQCNLSGTQSSRVEGRFGEKYTVPLSRADLTYSMRGLFSDRSFVTE